MIAEARYVRRPFSGKILQGLELEDFAEALWIDRHQVAGLVGKPRMFDSQADVIFSYIP